MADHRHHLEAALRHAAKTPEFLTSKAVQERYCVTSMTLWRWTKSEKTGFPKPFCPNGRNLWRLADLEAWEAERAWGAS